MQRNLPEAFKFIQNKKGEDHMSIELNTGLGQITVSTEVIADVVGLATTECAGVVGMASQKRVKDGVAELLKRENYSKGIIVRNQEDGMHIDLHIVILYGLRINEIALTVQERVKHSVEELIGANVISINIIVEDVKVDNS